MDEANEGQIPSALLVIGVPDRALAVYLGLFALGLALYAALSWLI